MTSREIPNVQPGETIQTTWGNQVAQRTVQRYPTIGSFPTGVSDGELAYAQDSDVVYVRANGAWRPVAFANTSFQASSLGDTDIPSNASEINLVQVSIVPATANVAVRPRLVTAVGEVLFSAGSGRGQVTFRVRRDPGNVQLNFVRASSYDPPTAQRMPYTIQWLDSDINATGYRLTGQRDVAGSSGEPISSRHTITVVPA